MPHTISRSTGADARTQAAERPPFGPGFPPDLVARTEALTITGSSINDPGGDWTAFTISDTAGAVLGTRRINGY
jgi:hypothetical protein